MAWAGLKSPKNNFFFVSTHFSYGFERLKNLLGGIPEHRDILKEPNALVRAQEPTNNLGFSLNRTNFCEIDKTQMNKVFEGLAGVSQNQRLHCFIRSPINANSKEWFFAHAQWSKLWKCLSSIMVIFGQMCLRFVPFQICSAIFTLNLWYNPLRATSGPRRLTLHSYFS